MTQLVSQFESLGLSELHARIYESLLELGKATLKQLSEHAQIPRSSCYEYVPHLVRLGLVSEVMEGKTRYVVPERPERIQQLLDDQVQKIHADLDNLSTVLSDLSSQFNARKDRPSVKFLKGVEGIKSVLEETLMQDDEILVLCQGDESEHHLEDEPEYLRDYFKKFKESGARSREIIEDRGDAREYKELYEDKRQKILLAPPIKNIDTVHIDKLIYGDAVAVIEFEKELVVRIEDAMIAQNERLTFNVLWNALSVNSYQYSVNSKVVK